MQTYLQTINFLFERLPMFQRIGKEAYKANLDNTNALDSYFGHPHRRFKTIHVAGTNGKGSVSHLLASILTQAGYKTGLYTSPHMKDFRERIKVDGQPITEQEVVDFVNCHMAIIEKIEPSFFEMTVAMAFDHFERQKVDIAVIEVGLGGRLDSTNIIVPELSVITNIAFDHTAMLGTTLPAIASEKAGIIKPNVPIVIGETHPLTAPVFANKALNTQSQITWADKIYKIDFSTQTADFKQVFQVYQNGQIKFKNLTTPLLGWYQRKNAQTVLAAIDVLNQTGYSIDAQHIYHGFDLVIANTGLLGRWQVIGTNPLTVCDTAHNEAGISEVVAQIAQTPFKKLHMVIGMVNDKEITEVLKLLPKNAVYYFTKAAIPRALDELQLQEKANAIGLKGSIYPSVAEAVAEAKKNTSTNDLIFIGGSTFIVAEAL